MFPTTTTNGSSPKDNTFYVQVDTTLTLFVTLSEAWEIVAAAIANAYLTSYLDRKSVQTMALEEDMRILSNLVGYESLNYLADGLHLKIGRMY